MAEARLTARVETVGVKKASDQFELLTRRTAKAEQAVDDAAKSFLNAEKRTEQLAKVLKTATKQEKLAAAAALRLAKEEEEVAKQTFKAKKQQLTYAKSLEKSTKKTDRLNKSTKKSSATLKESVRAFRNITAAATAMTVAFVAVAIRQADVEKNLGILAFLAEETTNDFKALTFATEQVGISATKFADITKDINDKLADFVSTGGGEAKDIFETLGKEIKFTAQELQQMSGADTLQALKNAFDDANIPMAQQVFLFESLANDSAKLIPLLAENGIQLKTLEAEFKAVNEQILLSTRQQKDLVNLSKTFDLLGKTASNSASLISAKLAPALINIAEFWTEQMSDATRATFNFLNTFKDTSGIKEVSELLTEQARILQKVEDQEASLISAVIRGDKLTSLISQNRLRASNERLSEINQQIAKIKELDEVETSAAKAAIQREKDAAEAQLRLKKAREDKLAAEKQKIKDEAAARAQAAQAENFFAQTQKLGLSPLALVDAQENERLAKLDSFKTKELESKFNFEAAKTSIEADAIKQRDALEDESRKKRIESTQQTFTAITDLTTLFQDSQGSVMKAAFEVQKGFALASAINSVAEAQAQAARDKTALTVGQQIANVGLITTALLPILSTISGNSFSARQQGGQFSAGQNLLVGEQGPELVSFNSGGRIADARQTAGMQPSVTIVNQTSGRIDEVETRTDDKGDMIIIVNEVLNRAVLDPNSKFNKNLARTKNIQRSFNG